MDRLIVEELERRHIAGYSAHPPRADEDAWADVERDPNEIADDVDWARLYGVSRSPDFAAEAHRQSAMVATAGHAEGDQAFIDAISADLE